MDDAYVRSYPAIYRGIVESNIDPSNLGRCKVRVPSIHGELKFSIDALPWARPLVLSPVKNARGSVNIPDVGDIVWVLFEGAVKEFPVYFGGSYAKGELIISNDIVDLYIERDDRISYDRVSRRCTIKIGERELVVTPTEIIIVGDTSIRGNLTVNGKLTVTDLEITGSCNREGE